MAMGMTGAARLMATVVITLATAGTAFAADPALPKVPELGAELAALLVVAIVLESALATIFNWRVYREFFNGRAVKTLVMIAFGYALVRLFDYDFVARMVGYAGATGSEPWLSEILSALVLAGGSAAVFQLFTALGLRTPVNPAQRNEPPQDKAWVSVRIVRDKAIGEVKLFFDKLPETNPPDTRPALAGVVGQGGFGRRIFSLFFADPLRFPSYGGRTVEAEKLYLITASWEEAPANPEEEPQKKSDTIYEGKFAGRAIIDLVYTA